MPWRCTALEHLDDDHATAAARTARLAAICGGTGGRGFRFCSGEQLTRADDVVGASVFGEQAVDAVQAFGSTWMRKRRMNSSVSSVMRWYRSRPSTRSSFHLKLTPC